MPRPLSAETFPVDADEFAQLLEKGGRLVGPVAVAVSGGPDSMALALCMKRWGQRPLFALIVDHGLREGSATEASLVKQRLEHIGLHADILRWNHEPVTGRLHEQARAARYRLLTDACHRHGARALMTAHHRDDQAETILMRIAKGSGVEGLSGMTAQSTREGVEILRPFLGLGKDRLIATCMAEAVPFVADPSNGSDKFARGRLRSVMPLLEREGLTVENLLRLGARAAEAGEALAYYTQQFLAGAAQVEAGGSLRLDRAALRSVPRAVGLRAVARCLRYVHPDDHPPEQEALAILYETILDTPHETARTFYGCIASIAAARVTFLREESGAAEHLPLRGGETILWDKRWVLTAAAEAPAVVIAALGDQTHENIDRLAPGLRRLIPQGRVRASLPAVWIDGKIQAIPSFEEGGMFHAAYRKQAFP